MVLDQRLFKSLAYIFNESQDGIASHQRLIQKCQKLYQESEFSGFFDTFTTVMQPMLITMQKNPNVDRCIDFIAKFCSALNPQKPPDASQMDLDQTESDLNNTFLTSLINHLIEINRANCDAVRYRVCHLLGKLMSVISNDQSIDEDMYDRLCDAMLERLKDINSRVQVQAVTAIYRLQDPNDRDCRVIKALLFLMAYDPHWPVRFQALANIAFSKQTLPEIIDRVRDPHPQVRRKAILILSEKVLIKFISIEKRLFILNYALKDQDQGVVDACCKKLLPSWLAFKENDLCKLLKALDVVDSSSTCEMMLDKMYADNSLDTLCNEFSPLLNDKHVIPLEKLDAESIFYWHWICSKCKRQTDESKRSDQPDMTQQIDGQEHLDQLLPSLTEYCLYVEESLKKIEIDRQERHNDERFQLESIFLVKKLIEMFTFTDFSDVHGKKSLHNLCHKIFSDKNYIFLYETLMKVYKILHPNLQTRVNNLVELISDIKDPNPVTQQQPVHEDTIEHQESINESVNLSPQEIQFKISELKFQRFSLKDDFDKLYNEFKNVNKTVDMNRLNEIRSQIKDVEDNIANLQAQLTETPTVSKSTSAASVVPEQVVVQVEDPIEIAFHCLNIAVCLLEDVELKTMTPQIRSLCDSLIIPNISSVNEDLRSLAVCSLGLVCILKLEMAQKYVPLFLEVIQRDKKEIVVEAFKAMINCIMAYSVKKLVQSEDDELDVEATSKIMTVMTSLLDHDESDVYTLAVEGFCKLYMTGHILSAKLFSKLLIMYYSPLTENDVKLRAFLSAFLPQFSFFRACNQLCVEESFTITLKCLINAPADSYLSSIDLIKVMETLFNLINPKNLIQKNHSNICHENVVKSICYEILKDENSFKCKTYLKILQMSELNDADYLSLKNIHELADEVHEHIEDKTVKKMAKKFQETVYEIMSKKPEFKSDKSTPVVEETNSTVRQDETESVSVDQEDRESIEIMDYEFPKINKKNKSNKTLTRTLNGTQMSRRSSPRINRTSNTTVLNESSNSTLIQMKEVRVVLNKLDESTTSRLSRTNESKLNESQSSTLIESDDTESESIEKSSSKKFKSDPKTSLKRVNRKSRSKDEQTSEEDQPPSKVPRETRSKTSASETRSTRSKSTRNENSSKGSVSNNLRERSVATRASSASTARQDTRRSPRTSRK